MIVERMGVLVERWRQCHRRWSENSHLWWTSQWMVMAVLTVGWWHASRGYGVKKREIRYGRRGERRFRKGLSADSGVVGGEKGRRRGYDGVEREEKGGLWVWGKWKEEEKRENGEEMSEWNCRGDQRERRRGGFKSPTKYF